jgi:glycosyltransferase 2 family protein
MLDRFRKLWPYLKLVLAAVIVIAVGRRFYLDLRDHPEVWEAPLRPGWLLLSAVLYQVGIGFSGLFWYRLLRSLGQKPGLLASLRAYYISQLGKYVPGKAYAVVWRVDLIRGPEVRAGIAGMTTFYEVLVTMASGSLLAAVLFLAIWPDIGAGFDPARLWALLMQEPGESNGIGRGLAVALSLLLFLPPFLVTLPPIFNRAVGRISLPFRKSGEAPPHVRFRTKLEGLLITSIGWLCMGASVWALLKGVLPESQLPPTTLELLLRIIAVNAVVYVAGFEVLISPGGLGVREFLLSLFFVTILATASAGAELTASLNLASVALRLVWTAAEVLLALAVWRLPNLFAKKSDDSGASEMAFATSEKTETPNSAAVSTNGSPSVRAIDREGKP